MKTLLVALLGAIISTTTFAQVLFETDTPLVEVSVRAGKHGWRSDSDIKRSYGYQFELNILSQEYLPGLNLRVYGSDTTFDSIYEYGYLSTAELTDWSLRTLGGSLAITYNLNQNGVISPYIAAGIMYEESEEEAYISSSAYVWGLWGYKKIYDYYDLNTQDDGVTYIVRCGADVNYYSLAARFEGSLLGKVYDDYYDEEQQFELLAIIGWNITDWLRIEVAYDYFTEWKEYYLTGGITLRY